MRRITIMALLLFLAVMFFPEITYCTDEAVNECYTQLLQKYPNLEAIKKQFGDQAEWQRRTETSPHDSDIELIIESMEYPGIRIGTLRYTYDNEESFSIILVDTTAAGFVDFLGIDIGSSRDDVISKFGKPDSVEGNKLFYENESQYSDVKFIIEENKVVEMIFSTYPD